MTRGLLVVIAGPSGVGKGTVHARLRATLPDAVLSVSATTRAARPREVDGVHYRFLDRLGFEAMVTRGELLEWAEYAGNLYGTPRGPVAEAVADGKVVLLDIEVQGALQVREQDPDALLVFLAPPSFDELERRLRQRGTEDDVAVAARLEVARRELAQRDAFDQVVVNDDLERCVAEVRDAIAAARTG
ncbi:guanylate kinase [Egicoccus halophilus]|uniref:Guanylate kinase n=1 Tax=Egicoccus halophilus TaxID=1670830 RepID=A0A8J3A8X7_9ACTN|nr:guanylate kinase [Egicoccus halophilus]GGI07439.1 guanylate kinase [Egicoccus halophilus]